MKTVRVKTTKYLKQNIKFGPFLMKFNQDGIAELEIKDEQEPILDEVVRDFKNVICYLEDSDNLMLEAEKQKNVDYLNKVIAEKEEKIKALQISNDELAKENIQLKAELKAYKNIKKEEKKEEPSTKENSEGIEEDPVKKELESKTVPELKAILADVYKDFEDEWKKLTKKDDIINYMLSKTQNQESE